LARTPEGAALTQAHRDGQLALRAQILLELARLWRGVDVERLAETLGPAIQAAAALILSQTDSTTNTAAEYYLAFRAAEGIAGTIDPRIPPPPASAAVEAALRSAGLSGIVNARRRGESLQAALANGLVKASGAAASLMFAGARGVILDTVASDPAAAGLWQRITSDRPCAFCAMLASRGPVYNARTVHFESHPSCACLPEAAYPGSVMPPASEAFADLWDQTGDLNSFRAAIEGRAK